MTRRARPHPFSIRNAAKADTAAFLSLLAQADPNNPDPFGEARFTLASPARPPLSHDRALCLIAQAPDGTPIGALAASRPWWFSEHHATRQDPALVAKLEARVCGINGVAVDPAFRGRGVGAALIRHAERRCAVAGYGLIMLDHYQQGLDTYYNRLGYTTGDTMIVNLPTPHLFVQKVLGSRISVKSLEPRVQLTSVPGLPTPVICGLLPNTHLHRETFFYAGQLYEPAT